MPGSVASKVLAIRRLLTDDGQLFKPRPTGASVEAFIRELNDKYDIGSDSVAEDKLCQLAEDVLAQTDRGTTPLSELLYGPPYMLAIVALDGWLMRSGFTEDLRRLVDNAEEDRLKAEQLSVV